MCAATCFFLHRANDRGWSFFGKALSTVSGGTLGRPGLYHK